MSPVTPGNHKTATYYLSVDAHVCNFNVIFPTAPVETRSIAVNTPSLHEQLPSFKLDEPSRATGSYSLLLGTEDEELEAMLRELLAAFPTQTTESENLTLSRLIVM